MMRSGSRTLLQGLGLPGQGCQSRKLTSPVSWTEHSTRRARRLHSSFPAPLGTTTWQRLLWTSGSQVLVTRCGLSEEEKAAESR